MTDYRSLYDRDWLGAWDLQGRDVTVTIVRVVGAELTGQGGRKSRKPGVYFDGKDRGLALNKTNGRLIAGMYGPDTREWIGKRITLYPTTTTFGSDTVDCIRVRPQVPQQRGRQQRAPTAEPPEPSATAHPLPDIAAEREPGEDG